MNPKRDWLFRIWYSQGGRIPPPPPLWLPYLGTMIMKFGDVILHQKLYQEIIKHLMTSLLWRFYCVILYFSLCLGKKSKKNTNFFVFYPICLKFCTGGDFEMLIIKRQPRLKLENDLSKKIAIFYRFQPKL